MDNHQQPPDNTEGRIFSETFVFTGNGGQSFLTTLQTLMDRLVNGTHHQQPPPPAEPRPEEQRQEDAALTPASDPPVPELPADQEVPALEPLDGPSDPPTSDAPPSRPIRPLPRPHAHFHAHTPSGIIDLFTFNVDGPSPPPPQPGGGGGASFTFNLNGTDVLAGFEAFFLGVPGMKDREPDPERARVLVKGMEVVPEGLVRRLERAGGVPGGHGTEENAGCAVCWGPLLDEVEPGEWDTENDRQEKEKAPARGDDELHGRIVALPCAHVYHAECLLPWFSRQTTCPTCRLDVDPESLTWTPRPPPPPPPQAQAPPPPPPPPVPHAEADAPAPGAPPQPHAEQHRGANAAEAARLNAFMASILSGVRAHPPPPPAQPPNPSPSPPVFGPARHFFPLPLFAVPPHAHARAAPNAHAHTNSPPTPTPNSTSAHAHPAPSFALPTHPAPPPPPRKPWTPPAAVGRTLRQRVEAKERELGLRCDDAVCGAAPSDEDPVAHGGDVARVGLRAAYDARGRACAHRFHPACLVMSARVAGVGVGEEEGGEEEEVQVACPTCRAEGSLSRAEWDGGVRASEAEMA